MWKTKLGRCIYQSPSHFKVYQNFFYRWLTLDSSALQTVICRQAPHVPILYYVPALTLMIKKNPGNGCLLGLGGAAIPHHIHATCPNIAIDAVDHSLEIIQIASTFFKTDSLPYLTVIQQNAADFLINTSKYYLHILVDLYNANQFPAECANEIFFKHCARCLSLNGFLAINLANHKEQWPILNLIKKQFKHTLVIKIPKCSNIIVYAANMNSRSDFLNHFSQCELIKSIHWLEPWGCIAILKKLRPVLHYFQLQ